MKLRYFTIFLTALLLLALLCSCEQADALGDESARQTEKPTEATEAVCLHKYSEWQTETAPTCTSDGLEVRSCLSCGDKDDGRGKC